MAKTVTILQSNYPAIKISKLKSKEYFSFTGNTPTFYPAVLQTLDGPWMARKKGKLHNLPLFISILTLHLEKVKDNSGQCLFSSGTDNINFIAMP